MRRSAFILLGAVVALGIVWPSREAAAVDFSGSSRSSFQLAWADAEEDGDERGALFTEFLSLEGTGLPMRGTLFASGSWKWDMGSEGEQSLFYSSADSTGSNQRTYLYEAGVALSPAPASRVTLGRFHRRSAEPLHLDGAALDLGCPALPGSEVSAFVGRLVQFYDDLEASTVFGFGAKAPLPMSSRFTVDYFRLFDPIVRAELTTSPHPALHALAGAEWVDSDLREVYARADAWVEPTATRLTAAYRRKVGNESDADYLYDFTNDVDPGDYRIERLNLSREAPYNQYEARVDQHLFGEMALLSARYVKRDLIDEEHYEDAANTSFDVISAGVNLKNPGVRGLSLDARYSWWLEERLAGYESSSRSFALSAEQAVGGGLSAFASYYRKSEDINNQLENQTAEAFEAGASYKPDKDWDLRLSYTREEDDLLDELYGVDSVNTVETRLSVRF